MRSAMPRRETRALVGSDWLIDHLDDPTVRIVEIDVSSRAYEEGHIPGASLWNIYADLRTETYRPNAPDALTGLLRRSGITADSIVVCYGYAPALGYWLLKQWGHDQARVLDCGRSTWLAAGQPWTTEITGMQQSDYVPRSRSLHRADRGAVVDIVESGDEVIVDVRSREEFEGERFWPSGGVPTGGRAGRIPTAIHVPADGIMRPDGSFRPAEQIAAALSGVPFDVPIVTYCTVGARAATVWFALTEILGHPAVRVYDGSWAEWGMDPTVPIAAGQV